MRLGLTPAPRGFDFRSLWLGGATLVLGVPVALALVRIAVRAGMPYYLGYNEGWNAFHAQSAITGGALYPPLDSMVMNNYPPLSFYLVGWVGSLLGDNILAGRYIAFAAFLLVIACIYLAARGLAADRLAAAFGAATAAATLLLIDDRYAGMSDPQMLAHGVAMAGLAVFVHPRLGRWPAGLVGGALIAASCFVKHIVIVLPIVLFLSCLLYRRRMIAPLVGGAAAVIALVGTWITLSFGTPFLAQFLAPRIYSLARMIVEFSGLAQATLTMVGAAVFLLLCFRPQPATVFAAAFTLGGYALALVFLRAEGVDANAGFEGIIGGGLAFALLLTRLGAAPALATVAIVIFHLGLSASVDLQRRHLSLTRTLEAERALTQETAADVALIRAHPGPAICEAMSLCYWAGKPFLLDPFNANQAFRNGLIPESRLLDRIRAKELATIELLANRQNAEKFGQHFSPAFDQALAESYELARKSPVGAIFVPKP